MSNIEKDGYDLHGYLKETEVKSIRIDLHCQRCGCKMKPTGRVIDLMPPMYPHGCSNKECNEKINVGRMYPVLTTKEVETPTSLTPVKWRRSIQ
jgi:hypothetical protein